MALALSNPAPASAEVVLRSSSIGSDIATLDPHRAIASADVMVISWMFNGLVRFKPGSADPKDLEPDLAERWETSPDGKTWTFYLRKGVTFHGGWGEFTADDVIYSLNRAADPQRSSFAADFANIAAADKVDDDTVRIVLKHPDAAFLGVVSNYHGGYIVSRKAAEKLGTDFGAHPVGTGPFAFVEHVTQQYVKLTANADYFRGRPKIDTIMERMIPADTAREFAFTAGELDIAAGKPEQRWIDAARKHGIAVDIFAPGEYRTLHLNRTVPPLDDIRVRQALAHAVNVADILRYYGKDVTMKGCSVVPPGYLGESCAGDTYAYDPAKARALLAESGHAGGFTLKVVSSNVQAQLPLMEIVQSQLAKIGVKLDLEVVDHPTYHAQIRKDVSAIVLYGAARFPTADAYLTQFYHSNAIVGKPTAITNFSHCAAADAEIDAARIEPDPAKQLALWATAQRKIDADVCAIPLFDLRQVWEHSNRVDYGYDLKGAMNLGPVITETTTLKPE